MNSVKPKYNPLDYIYEYCPECDEEVVIYDTGITYCPKCGCGLIPCSICENGCRSKCTFDKENNEKRKISKEEVEFVEGTAELVFYRELMEKEKRGAENDDNIAWFWISIENLKKYVDVVDIDKFFKYYTADDTIDIYLQAKANGEIICEMTREEIDAYLATKG